MKRGAGATLLLSMFMDDAAEVQKAFAPLCFNGVLLGCFLYNPKNKNLVKKIC
jgi:hypothetical protein